MALGAFEISRFSGTHLESIAAGEARHVVKHPPRLVVKAVTYHQLKVQKLEHAWVAEVYVDV